MDTNTLFIQLRELGHVNNKRQELKDYCLQHYQEIIELLPQKILNNDGPDVLDCMLNGLADNSASTNIKTKIIDIALQSLIKNTTSTSQCNDIISRVCLELCRCPSEDLVRWSNDCTQSIIEDTDVNMIWRDILPECFHTISSYNTIKHCNTDITPDEYKEKVVTTLCQCQWKEKQLVPLTSMFHDMQLSRSDHKQVVNKICTYLCDVPPESVPPLVHQLLKLCKTLDMEIVLTYLSEYFKTRLYSKLEPPKNDSESTTMDIDDIAPNTHKELSNCLSTCLYHIIQGASYPEFLIKRLKAWPTSQILRNPLLIDISLALSDKGADFRSTCLAIVKDAIEQRELDEIRRKESAWVREGLSADVDVTCLLKTLTTESIKYCNVTSGGLINLAFVLLSIPKSKPVAANCWSHGRLILVRVCKGIPDTTRTILTKLGDKDLTLKKYSDCLYVLCKLLPRTIERCTHITTLLENVLPQDNEYRHAARVYHAAHPLLHFSAKVRDCMVILCRKTLYSKDSHYRCLALSGFLILLRYSKISNVSTRNQLQQDQCSAHSYLSQLTIELHTTQNGTVCQSKFSNDSMCFEVMSIIKRCLIQDANVKQLLYSDIYKCIEKKLVLHEIVLEMFYEHLFKYLCDDVTCPPLLWDKCVQITPTSAVLVEPIGYLIYSISQFFRSVEEDVGEDIMFSQSEAGSVHLKNKLTGILDDLTSRGLFTDLILESDQIPLTSVTPDSKAKYIKLQQILQTYEALIAFQIQQWTVNSENTHNTVLKLFKAYNQILDYVKSSPKKKLKTTQKSQSSSKDKSDLSIKCKSKDRMAPFKPLPCLWDLEFCSRIIELLYGETVEWCDMEHRNAIRTRREFHTFALNRVHSILNEEVLEKYDVTSHGIDIAKVLFKRCLLRFQDICNFDESTGLACVDLLKDFISLFLSKNYAFKIDKLLPAITGDTALSTCIAAILEATHDALLSLETSDSENDEVCGSRKLCSSLCSLASRVMYIPVDSCCPRLAAIISKFDTYIRKTKNDITTLLPALLYISSRDNQDSELIDDLLATLSLVLSVIGDETVEEIEIKIFPSLDEKSGHAALAQLCTQLSLVYQHITLQITHAKQKITALQSTTVSTRQLIEKDLKKLKKSLVIQLCQYTKWTQSIGTLRCTIGSGSDKVLMCYINLYSLLGDFVKLLSMSVTPEDIAWLHNMRFDRLMNLSGKSLSTSMDDLIEYMVQSQNKKKGAHEVLKDTKHIPRLVLEAEQFKKLVLVLSKKTKINYEEYMPVGTARDFKIKAPILNEALQNVMEDGVSDVQDDDTVVLSPQSDRNDVLTDNEENQPVEKKRRL